jgi:RNA polymerase sigma-70 factor (ECF subfamily)
MLRTHPHPAEDTLAAQLQARVQPFIRRLVRDPHEAEEVLSQTLLAFMDHTRARGLPRRPEAWALQVAWNKVIDLRRRRRASVDATPNLSDLPAPDLRPQAELRDWLESGMAHLSETDRALLHLRYTEGLDDRTIARILACPRGTVARRLHNARRRLGDVLSRIGGGLEVAGALTLLGLLGSPARAAITPASAGLSLGAWP